MCETWDRILLRIGIKIKSQILILVRIGNKTMPIHNTRFCLWGEVRGTYIYL